MEAFIRALPGVFEAIDATDEARNAFLLASWKRIAGAQLLERTGVIGIDRRTLIIAVADRTWKRNLESLAPQLLYKLNASMGGSGIDRIEFRIAQEGLLGRPEPAGRDAGILEAFPVVPDEISLSAEAIRDPRLRHMFLLAAGNCLSRDR